MKKIIYLTILVLILTANISYSDEGYVSPESYAVNEADMTDYMSIPAPSEPKRKHKKQKIEYEIKPDSKVTAGIKSWLRERRYNAQEPHHGQLHEIKVNSKYKQNLEKEKQEEKK